LDLTQAEAVLGLIDARHERQFATALEQLAGGLSGPLGRLREELLELLAHLEAGLDFATEDIEFITAGELEAQLAAAAEHVASITARMQTRLENAEAPRVVLYGWPNVGKSSLFNALARREQALVSPLAGTTRDYLTAELCLDGLDCRLVDTAGVELFQQDSTLAAAARQMRGAQESAADLLILCLDSTRPLNEWEHRELASVIDGRLIVLTKIDHPSAAIAPSPEALPTSAVSGAGLDLLRKRIARELCSGPYGEAVASTAVRCRDSLHLAAECLERARELAARGGFEELVAAEVRTALEEIGRVVGAVYTDEVLDRIFSRFCIGK
jgi:tRNA modification GTPase